MKTDYLEIGKNDQFEEELNFGVGGTRQFKLDAHNLHWGALYDRAKEYIKHGFATSSAVWQLVSDVENGGSTKYASFVRELPKVIWNKKVIKIPVDMEVVGFRQLIFRKVNFYLQKLGFGPNENGDGIFIETGAGWGRNLFYMLHNRFMPSLQARIYMGEFSASGRALGRMLSDLHTLETASNPVFVGPFDYYNPSLCWVSKMEANLFPERKTPKRAMVFSSYSIEQIPTVPPEYLEVALQLAEKVVGFHIEPIAPQMKGGSELMEPQLNIAKQYSQNFMKLLRDYESKGKIKILEELPRWADNNHNMRDDAGLVIWEKI